MIDGARLPNLPAMARASRWKPPGFSRGRRSQFNPSDQQIWYDRASDYARSYGSTYVWDVAYRIVSRHDSIIYTREEAITAIHEFARTYFVYQYSGADNYPADSLTAYETAGYLANYDGSTPTTRKFDCSDMAAFISGMATAFGIPSRMISISDRQLDPDGGIGGTMEYYHMVVELYGKDNWVPGDELPDNNNWFLIDPGHPDGEYYSSYNTAAEILYAFSAKTWAYGGEYYDGTLGKMWFIENIPEGSWGSGVDPLDRATSWWGNQRAPFEEAYVPNPWAININEYP